MRRMMLKTIERSMALSTSSMQARCLSAAAASTSSAHHFAGIVSPGTGRTRTLPCNSSRTGPSSWGNGVHYQQRRVQHQQRQPMFIQTSATPNPASLMFLPGTKVMESGSASFDSPREGMSSPLAKRLFAIDGVTGVFFGSDFVTVTKTEDYTWKVLKPEIFAAMMEHFTSGDEMFTDASAVAPDTAISEDDSEVVAMIKELLETRIRPAVQEDGGDIVFQGFDEETGQVVLKMQGACSGCPSSSLTLKSGIENMLMHYIPEVKEVIEAPADEAELAGLEEFNKLEQHLSA